ncbi:MAG: hypothetical protein CO183_00285 [Candidatus Zambryskibacteria bacterium CG_4_9_14_3_um_filter_42_9]|uniref:TVP38/TMEM64 family membrane protein n=1 Tax=Candidatus Zambryskibacteria bacterium CG22_combo_CG10-13_8_21_14_all_42_17 TaxID=1975118 RepID=A0A2H0BD41_9BACT|nr:MAG: hypothetical protein COX06_02735 [Candidatus Zambryskibacteria bacterium CG22_combo_CG10-13_8_21_14_all_42_17]PJA37046.1 MAG: hypothetical protein CO183_00285 [Candidatus Zambryskibacteria bacterium CG_4_9_14_3_um_filter_42_9]
MNHSHIIRHFIRDVLILVLSIVTAILLINSGFVESFIGLTGWSKALSSFIAGAFFTSIFTVVPAGVALAAVSHSFSAVLVAFFGALGAMLIDVLIISFIRKDIAKDLDGLTKMTFRYHLIKAFHFGFLKYVAFLFGIMLIATPLPDEPGLFLIGISKINPLLLPAVFFVSHFIGIWVIISITAVI